MKTIIPKLLTILFIAALFSACNGNMLNSVSGNRNVRTENRSVTESFTRVKVSTGLELYLTKGVKPKITVEADENLQDIIITEVKNGVLYIYSEKNIWKAGARKVYVTAKTLEGITATSGAEVYTQETITADIIDINASSGAQMEISLDANSVETNATSGAHIYVFGLTEKHTSSATSGASIEAYKLRSKQVTARVTSGADINIYASESMSATATSGGDIDFKGSPKKISKTKNSGGSISPK
ncbi:MAG: hypothetical protein ACJA1B_001851 [Polaribacter sp.]|jgi:hypothetical protein